MTDPDQLTDDRGWRDIPLADGERSPLHSGVCRGSFQRSANKRGGERTTGGFQGGAYFRPSRPAQSKKRHRLISGVVRAMTDQLESTALRRLEIEMREAEKAYRAAKERYEQAIKDSNPIKPGDVIRSAKGTLAKVVSIGIRWDEPEIFAVLKKKDGTFGKRQATMWRSEWDKPEVVA